MGPLVRSGAVRTVLGINVLSVNGGQLVTQHKSGIQFPKKLKSIQAGNFEIAADIWNLHFAGVRRYRRLMGYDRRSQCFGFGNNPWIGFRRKRQNQKSV